MTTSIPVNNDAQTSGEEVFVFPASFAQKRLWFLDQLAPGASLYNIPGAYRITGLLDVETLRRSVQAVYGRHEALRTCFRAIQGEPQQVVMPETPIELLLVDLSSGSEVQWTEVQRRVQEFLDGPFDLRQAPLWRARLFRIAENDHIVATVMHHIISDGWSMGVLWTEISVLYSAFTAGKPSPLPELSIQYPDFSAWQQEFLQGKVLEKQLSYWKNQLAGIKPLNLPFDRPRPPVGQGKGETLSFMVERDLAEKLQSLSRQHTASLYMTLLAAFQLLLFRYTGQRDFVLATAIAGRTRVELEQLIGFFVNTLLLRSRLADQWSFHDLLRKVKETTLGAYEHQDVPFERLVQEIAPDRDPQASMMFQVTFTLQNMPATRSRFGKAEIDLFPFEDNSAKFDIAVALLESNDGIPLAVAFDKELFEAATIQGMLERYLVLLQHIVEDPDRRLSELSLLSEEEQRSLLAGWSTAPLEDLAPENICACIADWAQRTPEAPAIAIGDTKVTYRQLNQQANQFAHHLHTLGIRHAARVGVGLAQPEKFLVAILGVMKAGAVFVPFSPEDPILRVREITGNSRIALVITETSCAQRWSALQAPLLDLDLCQAELAAQSTAEPNVAIDPQAVACVLYRSAPAGTPQGVLIHHWALSNRRFGTELDFHASDCVAQNLSFSYELAPFGIFAAWAAGACIVPIPNDPAPSPNDLARFVKRHGVTVMFIWAAMVANLARQAPLILQQFRLLFCGDKFSAWKGLREILDPEVLNRIYWFYGFTEATGWLLASRIAQLELELEIAPVEQIVHGADLHLLDEEMAPVPDNTVGELYVSTRSMSMGFEGNPLRTAENFVPDPFSQHEGLRMYGTGEMCRRRSGGRLQFCGRRDTRTRIYEMRVEPAEIEALLLQPAYVQEASVLALEKAEAPETSLAAFVVADREETWNAGELRQYLSDRLPEIMLPAEYIRLQSIPQTAEGQPDPDALRKMTEGAQGAAAEIPPYVAPRNSIEEQLAAIWARTFKLEQVGVHDSFFRLGGHSLFATVMVAQIIDKFRVDLPVRRLFEAPTIAKLALIIEQLTMKGKDSVTEETLPHPILVEIQGKGTAAPFFFVHPVGGHVFCYADLAAALGEEQPFYGLQAPRPQDGHSITTIEEMANLYLKEIRSVQPAGPYFLGGWSIGGVIAWQIAKQMLVEGEAVGMLVLVDTSLPPKNLADKEADEVPLLTWFALDLGQLVGKDVRQFSERFQQLDQRGQYEMIVSELQREGVLPQDPALAEKRMKDFYEVFERNAQAVREYQVTPLEQEIVVFQAGERGASGQLGEQWAAWSHGVISHTIPGNHYTMLKQPSVSLLADHLRSSLRDVRGRTPIHSPAVQ